MNFIFNEDPELISQNCRFVYKLFYCNFTADSFTNKAQFDAEFSKRLKLKDYVVPIILTQV